jgi:pimeloyl-ACP methyl ester carboxylesterase
VEKPRDYQAFDVAVPGGALRVGQWGGGPEVVLAVHGLTANHRSFSALGAAIGPGFSLVAPDLRGRGRSASVAGRAGMAAHALDLVQTLDYLGVDRAAVLGHSMGGFVGVELAAGHPERVSRLVLVDGGLPLELGPLADRPVEEVIRAVVGPALDRLDMTFPSVDAYLQFWRRHPALGADWNVHIEDTYRYDLVGEPPSLRSAVAKEAVLEDSASQLEPGRVESAILRLEIPVALVWAGRGMFGQPPGLYSSAVVEKWEHQLRGLRAVVAPDLNHYTIVLSEPGAAVIAAVVAGEASGGSPGRS